MHAKFDICRCNMNNLLHLISSTKHSFHYLLKEDSFKEQIVINLYWIRMWKVVYTSLNWSVQVLLAAYSRCVSVLSQSSTQDDMNVQVCLHCTCCFTVAAQFPACRNSFVELPQLIDDLVRILHFKVRICIQLNYQKFDVFV